MRLVRLWAGLAASLLLAACATLPANPLAIDRVNMMRLEAVDVQVAPNAMFRWGQAEREFAEKHGEATAAELSKTKAGAADVEQNKASAIANSPAAQAYIRQKAAQGLQSTLLREVGGALHGHEPVRLQVTILAFTMPSAAQRVTICGQPMLQASVRLVEAGSGREIANYPSLLTIINAGNGIIGVAVDQFISGDHFEELAGKFATQYRQWLVKT